MQLRFTSMLAVLVACSSPGFDDDDPGLGEKSDSLGPDASVDEEAMTCNAYFGAPNFNSGMSSDQCGSSCPCNSGFEAPNYDEALLATLEEQILDNAPEPPSGDPYSDPDSYVLDDTSFCAVLLEPDNHYRLETFATVEDVEEAGGSITHFGACGACSTLQDLAVYLRHRDLTAPVQSCGLRDLFVRDSKTIGCIENLGFTNSCAQVWFYNLRHTRSQCLGACLRDLTNPYMYSNGQLNECITCDEEKSGPIFKAAAGRIRRNSGIPSAICRPCDEIAPVVHDYL